MTTRPLMLGAVAYDPKVVTIWEGFRAWFGRHDLDVDFVLYSNYERQVAAHLQGELDVAWNSPLAWIQTERAAPKRGRRAEAIAMRDTDRDLTSLIVVRADAPIHGLGDLRGKKVGVGAADSPQATLIPLLAIAEAGVEPHRDVEVVRHDLLLGKHGDHIGGEREAVRALLAGTVDAACLIDGNHLGFVRDGTLAAGAVRVLAQTGTYDHCNLTVLDDAPAAPIARLRELLLGMSYDDPEVRPLLDLEGLKVWLPGRTEGYALLERGDPVRVTAEVDLGDLGLDEGGHLLIKHALAACEVGARVVVRGHAPTFAIDLAAWCRAQGHPLQRLDGGGFAVERGSALAGRWRGAERAGAADPTAPGAIHDHPPGRWGVAARGALVEAGTPDFGFPLHDRRAVWADEAARLYAQAAAAQWDPATAIPWATPATHPPAIEDAVVQVMTYLIENETAALLIPARFLARLHPHFREVMQLLAIQAADEARHIEVFTRRALLHGRTLGLSTAGGQASLQTLIDEPDFALAGFLLSVLGEGSFLSLLWFLRDHAPDLVTREVARLAAQDEARHVAFGLAHLGRHAAEEPGLRARLAAAVERRHGALAETAGLNEEVFDALVLLAAGSWEPAALRRGHAAVVGLRVDMDGGRRQRLARLGFSSGEAEVLSSLHTRNFM